MIIYPTIELQNGRCVSLFRGNLDEPQVWHVDPVAKAREFAEAGAEWIHVTDFDAVKGGDGNATLIDEIIRVGPPVQVAGGLRTREHIDHWIDRGAGRVVLGTMALSAPGQVKIAAKRHPDQIVLAVDVWENAVMSHGWRMKSAYTPEAFLAAFEADPLAAVIITDIHADMEEAEEPLALVTRLGGMAKAPVIASGMVRTLDDLARLKFAPHVSGAVIGRALFNKNIRIEDALALAAENAPVAPFS
jgi:phosphoribosylformimino-5-aminoimidazole carboxamide ribotide isomerase